MAKTTSRCKALGAAAPSLDTLPERTVPAAAQTKAWKVSTDETLDRSAGFERENPFSLDIPGLHAVSTVNSGKRPSEPVSNFRSDELDTLLSEACIWMTEARIDNKSCPFGASIARENSQACPHPERIGTKPYPMESIDSRATQPLSYPDRSNFEHAAMPPFQVYAEVAVGDSVETPTTPFHRPRRKVSSYATTPSVKLKGAGHSESGVLDINIHNMTTYVEPETEQRSDEILKRPDDQQHKEDMTYLRQLLANGKRLRNAQKMLQEEIPQSKSLPEDIKEGFSSSKGYDSTSWENDALSPSETQRPMIKVWRTPETLRKESPVSYFDRGKRVNQFNYEANRRYRGLQALNQNEPQPMTEPEGRKLPEKRAQKVRPPLGVTIDDVRPSDPQPTQATQETPAKEPNLGVGSTALTGGGYFAHKMRAKCLSPGRTESASTRRRDTTPSSRLSSLSISDSSEESSNSDRPGDFDDPSDSDSSSDFSSLSSVDDSGKGVIYKCTSHYNTVRRAYHYEKTRKLKRILQEAYHVTIKLKELTPYHSQSNYEERKPWVHKMEQVLRESGFRRRKPESHIESSVDVESANLETMCDSAERFVAAEEVKLTENQLSCKKVDPPIKDYLSWTTAKSSSVHSATLRTERNLIKPLRRASEKASVSITSITLGQTQEASKKAKRELSNSSSLSSTLEVDSSLTGLLLTGIPNKITPSSDIVMTDADLSHIFVSITITSEMIHAEVAQQGQGAYIVTEQEQTKADTKINQTLQLIAEEGERLRTNDERDLPWSDSDKKGMERAKIAAPSASQDFSSIPPSKNNLTDPLNALQVGDIKREELSTQIVERGAVRLEGVTHKRPKPMIVSQLVTDLSATQPYKVKFEEQRETLRLSGTDLCKFMADTPRPPPCPTGHLIPIIDETKRYETHRVQCSNPLGGLFNKRLDAYLDTSQWEYQPGIDTMLAQILTKSPRYHKVAGTVLEKRKPNMNPHKLALSHSDIKHTPMVVPRQPYQNPVDGKDAHENIYPTSARMWPMTPSNTMVNHMIQQDDCNMRGKYHAFVSHISVNFGGFVFVNLEDIIASLDTAKVHVKMVLEALRKETPAYPNPAKVQLFVERLETLEHATTNEGIALDSHNVDTIGEKKVPMSKEQLANFLGAAGYLALNCANIQIPMVMQSKRDSATQPWRWEAAKQRRFTELKDVASKHRNMNGVALDYSPSAPPINMTTDKCCTGASDVIKQGEDQKIAEITSSRSGRFTTTQQNYPVHERELLATKELLEQFGNLLQRVRFRVFADHKALEFSPTQQKPARQTKLLVKTDKFGMDVSYIPGKTNLLTDTLSRMYGHKPKGVVRNKLKYVTNAGHETSHILVGSEARQSSPTQGLTKSLYVGDKIRAKLESRNEHTKELPRRGQCEQKQVEIYLNQLHRERKTEKEAESSPGALNETESIHIQPSESLEELVVEQKRTHREPEPEIKQEMARTECATVFSSPESLVGRYKEDPTLSHMALEPNQYQNLDIQDKVLRLRRDANPLLCVPNLKIGPRSIQEVFFTQTCSILAHIRAKRTLSCSRSQVWWNTMADDVRHFCESCTICAANDPNTQHPMRPLQTMPETSYPRQSIDIKILGPLIELDTRRGTIDMIATIIDNPARVMYVISTQEGCIAKNVATVEFEHMYMLHGVLESMIADYGSIFLSTLWTRQSRPTEMKLPVLLSHHPRVDGIIKRIQPTYTGLLRMSAAEIREGEVKNLPAIKFALSSARSEATRLLPFYLNHGQMPSLTVKNTKSKLAGVHEHVKRTKFAVLTVPGALVGVKTEATEQIDKHQRSAEIEEASKVVEPYKIARAITENVLHEVELRRATEARGIHPVFHASLVRVSVPSDDGEVSGGIHPQIMSLKDTLQAWTVHQIPSDVGEGRKLIFRPKQNTDETTRKPYQEVKRVKAPRGYRKTQRATDIRRSATSLDDVDERFYGLDGRTRRKFEGRRSHIMEKAKATTARQHLDGRRSGTLLTGGQGEPKKNTALTHPELFSFGNNWHGADVHATGAISIIEYDLLSAILGGSDPLFDPPKHPPASADTPPSSALAIPILPIQSRPREPTHSTRFQKFTQCILCTQASRFAQTKAHGILPTHPSHSQLPTHSTQIVDAEEPITSHENKRRRRRRATLLSGCWQDDHHTVSAAETTQGLQVDSQLAANSSLAAVSEILNGCMCCILVGQMKTALLEIRDQHHPDRIIIESSGSAFPATLAFQIRELERETDGDFKLDAIVTVVDAESFVGYEDTSPTAKMQAQYTDVILLNKWEHVSERDLDIVIDHLSTLNDLTPKLRCEGKSGVPPNLIFGLDSKQFLDVPDATAKLTGDHHSEVETMTLHRGSADLVPRNHVCDHDHGHHSDSTGELPVLTAELLGDVLGTLPKDSVYRVKGFICTTSPSVSGIFVLNWAFGRFELIPLTTTARNPAVEHMVPSDLLFTVMGAVGDVKRYGRKLAQQLGAHVV